MNKNIFVGKSKASGKGVFAGKDFKKGQTVAIAQGKIIKINPKTQSAPDGDYLMGVGKNTWIEIKDGLVQFLNHSCNPNLGIKGKVTFVAMKNIKKGEELTFDYSISEEDVKWKMKNLEPRNTKDFRPIIGSIQSLPLKIYKKYLPYVPRYFQEVYKTENNLKRTN